MALPAGASAAVTGVLAGHTMNRQAIPCVTQSDGVRVCTGDETGPGGSDLRFQSFDGTPLQVYVTLPPAPASGADGQYPLMLQNHGWGAPPTGPNDPQYSGPTADQWAHDGYVVVQFADRGWGDSCGNEESRLVNVPACARGYVHLDDYRYEARDVQYATGLLVDAGLVDPGRIGATGESYGAGLSLELATLKDRVMNADGSLSPWKSPGGIPLHIAAAAPQFGWSDLVNALAPNGRTLDYKVTSPTADLSPVGVEKDSIVNGLYATGVGDHAYYASPGLDPQADPTRWVAQTNAGEPYTTPMVQDQVQQFAEFRSPYYMLQGDYGFGKEAPAPLFLTNGFTDDIFPVDEAMRYVNLEHELYPSDPVALFNYDGGHQRGGNKPADSALLLSRVKPFLDYYVKGAGTQPTLGVTALTLTCPKTASSGGPYWAPTWAGLHPGEVDYASKPAQTILSAGGDPQVAVTFDTIGANEMSNVNGLGWPCQTASANPEPGIATYRLPAASGSGYTLLGAPTVTADLNVTGQFPYVAARLLDVDPATNTEILLARGLYRIDPNAPNGRVVFQLHPGAWRFAAGHIPELELLGKDSPYSRPSNGSFSINVSDLQLRLPVHETPGAPGTPPVVTNPKEN
jgi:dienelactone hydrolase